MRTITSFFILALFLSVPAFSQDLGELMKQLGGDADLSALMANSNVELEDSYDYDLAITYKVESAEMDKPAEFKQLLANNKKYMGMEVVSADGGQGMPGMQNMMTIFDVERSLMLLMSENEKQAIVMAFDPVKQEVEEAEKEEMSDISVEKTGETKEILGYTCTKYTVQGPDGTGEIWVTSEIKHEGGGLFSYLSQLQQGQGSGNSLWEADIEGFVLEMKGTDGSGENFSMVATAIDTKAKIGFKMDDYQVIDLSALQKMQGGN